MVPQTILNDLNPYSSHEQPVKPAVLEDYSAEFPHYCVHSVHHQELIFIL